MSTSPRTSARRVVLAAAAVSALTAGVVAAQPATAAPAPRSAETAAFKLHDLPAHPSGPVAVFVQTSGPGALAVDASSKGGRVRVGAPTSRQALARVASVTATTTSVAKAVRADDTHTRVLYTSAYTVPGVALVASVASVRKLAARSDVVSVTPLLAKTIVRPVRTATPTGDSVPTNAGSDIYTRTLQTWQQTHRTGAGVNIAVIDTGLDYTHADFGGPGTTAAYYAAGRNLNAPTAGSYDPTKYLGGYDFAGQDYNAGGGSTPYDPYPAPDANPIDGPGGGHGTHVAGTAAGFGEATDGTTFRGDYGALTEGEVKAMKIGPGAAPSAGLYSLKIFGDFGGSTNLAGAALDWVGRALTQGKKIDVVSMSIGTDYAAGDDPDNAKIDALADQGVLPVVAQGNAGDNTDIGGSPGSSRKALTVAAANSGYATLDGIAVAAPADLVGASPYLGQYSLEFDDELPVAGTVAVPTDPSNLTGCSAFSAADAARLKGGIAWLQWDDDNVLCGSATRFDNAQKAGATGVLLTGTKDVFENGIAGNAVIPGIELTKSAVAALRPAALAGTLTVQFRDDLRAIRTVNVGTAADTIASFSSRGSHGSYGGVVKPDVAAPGVNITSAKAGGGSASTQMSGTSMATPDTSGIAALVKQEHPSWTGAQLKADIMNTATHDLTSPTGRAYGVLRQGTGRIDALQAVTNHVTVVSDADNGLVTASFGVVALGKGAYRATRTLTLTNRGTVDRTYRLAYSARTALPGVTFSLSTTTATVQAGLTARVVVTAAIPSPTALRRTLDPTQASRTTDGKVRDFVSAASGVVTFTPTSTEAPPLRLAVFIAPKPSSDMHATVAKGVTATTAKIALTGRALAQGSGSTAYRGSVLPFVLGATSPALRISGPSRQTLLGLDLEAVGANSTAPLTARPSAGLLTFGIQTFGPEANPGTANYPAVNIDVDGDGRFDFQTTVRKNPDTDRTVAVTFDLALNNAVDVEPFDANYSGVDANVFDSTVMALPVSLAKLGYTDRTKRTVIRYQVVTQSPYATPTATAPQGQVDASPVVTFDVFHPAAWFVQPGGDRTGRPLMNDSAVGISARRSSASAATRVLLLHTYNVPGRQADVLTLPAVVGKKA